MCENLEDVNFPDHYLNDFVCKCSRHSGVYIDIL